MNNGNFSALLPLIFFMFVMVVISIFVRHKQAEKKQRDVASNVCNQQCYVNFGGERDE